MNLHTIAVAFILLGLALMLYCVIWAEICYRKVERYIKRNAAARASADGADGKS